MIIFLIIISILTSVICIHYHYVIKELRIKITKLELEIKNILERKLLTTKEKDTIPIGKISSEYKDTINYSTKKLPKTINQQSSFGRSEIPITPRKKIPQPAFFNLSNFESTNSTNEIVEKNLIEKENNFDISEFCKIENANSNEKDFLEKKEYLQEKSVNNLEQIDNKEINISKTNLPKKEIKFIINENDKVEIFIDNLKKFRNNLNS